MSYTSISKVRNGRALLEYLLSEQGHNDNEVRNQLIIPVGMAEGDAASYHAQMAAVWSRRSSKNICEMNHVVCSLSKNEVDPDSPEDILLFGEMMQRFCEKVYPGHQALICVQTDGKGGCAHAHIGINRTHSITHKGLAKEQTWDMSIRREMDTILSEYITIDHGQKDGSRSKTIEEKRNRGEYLWRDDLVERIKAAQAEATDLNDFLDNKLLLHGVNGIRKKATKKQPEEYITYELIATDGFGSDDKIPKRAMKAKSFKLDADYSGDFSPRMSFGRAAQTAAPSPAPAPAQTTAAPAQTLPPPPAPVAAIQPDDQDEQDEQEKRKQEHIERRKRFDEWRREMGKPINADRFLDDYAEFEAYEAAQAAEKAPQEAIPSQEPLDATVSVSAIQKTVAPPDTSEAENEDARRQQAAARKVALERQRQQSVERLQRDQQHVSRSVINMSDELAAALEEQRKRMYGDDYEDQDQMGDFS